MMKWVSRFWVGLAVFAGGMAPAFAQQSGAASGSQGERQSTSGRLHSRMDYSSEGQSPARRRSDLSPSAEGHRSAALVEDARIPAQESSPPKAAPMAEHEKGPYHYREISDFFNIREAYANLEEGEWEFETWIEWDTMDGRDDNFGPILSLKYGLSDTMWVELEVEQINIGDGGEQGNGELELLLFKQWWDEEEILPAFATWAEMRIPSGEGSSGVDGDLHFTFTKQLAPNWRGHIDGFVETANGARGGADRALRRDFEWGVGPGIDYSFSDDTIATVNYLHRSSDELGNSDLNILEVGGSHRIAENQFLKLAFDVGLDGGEETPNFAAKLLWSIEWK